MRLRWLFGVGALAALWLLASLGAGPLGPSAPEPVEVHRDILVAQQEGAGAHLESRTDAAPSRADPVDEPLQGQPSAPRRRFGGHVVTSQGAALEGVRLFVFDRAPLPGESADRVQPVQVMTASRGAFATSLPHEWAGATVFVTVWQGDRQLGMGSHPVALDATVMVPDPNSPPGVWLQVRWPEGKPENAALMLQSHDRTIQFAEAVWNCREEKVFLPFRYPEAELQGRLSLFVGELPDLANPHLAMLKVIRLDGLPGLLALQGTTIDVECAEQQVRVPPWNGLTPDKVGLWTKFDAREARLLTVERGEVRQLMSSELDYSALGSLGGRATLLGHVRRGNPHQIVWQQQIDPELRVDVRVRDARGAPMPGAIARFALSDNGLQPAAQHRKAGRADGEGRILANGFCRADYDLTVETMELGAWRRKALRLPVPGEPVTIVLPDAFVGRLVPVGLPAGANIAEMRGWVRPPDGTWRECTDREWRFMGSGLLGFNGPGPHELMVRLPPHVGRASHQVAKPNEVVDVEVRMTLETEVRGRIVDSAGKAVVGRWVSVFGEAKVGRPNGPSWTMANTEDDGGYQLSLVPGLSGDLYVWDPGCTRVIGRVPAAPGIYVVGQDK